jgi:hypothetical protein
METKKFYTIYTKRLAYELRERGFKIEKTGVNWNHPQFDTYIFRNSDELQKAINEIVAKKNK